jgi:hypothetical protein
VSTYRRRRPRSRKPRRQSGHRWPPDPWTTAGRSPLTGSLSDAAVGPIPVADDTSGPRTAPARSRGSTHRAADPFVASDRRQPERRRPIAAPPPRACRPARRTPRCRSNGRRPPSVPPQTAVRAASGPPRGEPVPLLSATGTRLIPGLPGRHHGRSCRGDRPHGCRPDRV